MSSTVTFGHPNETLRPDLTQKVWDFIIIGAGPAGGMAAYSLSKSGLTILLVDQAEFPRRKVCGGCLSRRAVKVLERAGLSGFPEKLSAKKLHTIRFFSAGRSVSLSIPEGAGLSRERLDAALVEEAQKRGVVFEDRTKGRLDRVENDLAYVHLTRPEGRIEARAKIVLFCSGLSGTPAGGNVSQSRKVIQDSLIGLSTVLPPSALSLEEGVVAMICSDTGYAGITRREDNHWDVAAAVQPVFLKGAGTPGRCVDNILAESGFKIPNGLHDAAWHGTPPLTQSQERVSGNRYFLLGDASGYVEPLTGEGMTWALLQGQEISELLESRRFQWDESLVFSWQNKHRLLLQRRMQSCRLISLIIRRAWARNLALNLLRAAPWLAHPLIRYIHGDSK